MNTQTNLPLELSSLVGRNSELSNIRHLLVDHRLVTLSGPGGTGKTRIAKKVARSLIDNFTNGVWFVDLTGVFRNAGVAGAVSRALGVLEEEQTALSDTIAQRLADRSTLLVLDNCEQVLAGCAEVVQGILKVAPAVSVLTTSREPLHLSGEFVRRMPPLTLDAGVELFLERARQAGSDIATDGGSSDTIRKIIERLDGVPLAIELAAARTTVMASGEILAGLENRFDLLTGGARDAMDHHRSMKASVAWSYDLMSEAERVLARRLCVLRGFTLAAADAVGADVVPDDETVLDLLQRLVDISMVQLDRSGKEPRFRFLETVREYLVDRLGEAIETQAARTAHLSYFIEFAEYRAQRLILKDGPELMAQIETEFDNLEDALVFAESHDDPGQILRLLTALTGYYEIWGHYQHGMRWFDVALARTGAPDVLTARALWGASHVCVYGGRADLAFPRAQRALEMAQELGDTWTEARALDIIGFAQSVSDPEAAYQSLSRCIQLGAEIKDSWAETHGIKMITAVYLFSHEIGGGSASVENLIATANKHNSRYLRAWGNAVKGYFARDGGDLDAAESALAISVENARYVGDHATGGFAFAWSSALKADRGQVDEARQAMQEMMRTASATGTFLAVPETMFQLGMIEVANGNPEVTLEMIGGQIEGLKSAGIPVWASQLAIAAAAAHIDLGHFEEAGVLLDDAGELSASLNSPFLDGLISFLRGRRALDNGDAGEAEAQLHTALERQLDAGLLPGSLRTMESIADILIGKERLRDAARVIAFIDHTRADIRLVRGASEDARHQFLLGRLDEGLGTEVHMELRETAAKSDMKEIIGLISRMRGKRARPLMGWKSLTPTESRVVALAAEGLSNPEIAAKMFVARGTVKVHLSRIYEKLDVKSRTQLAAKAVTDGFLTERN